MAAYIMIEEKKIWRWHLRRYVRNGWDIVSVGHLWARIERCVG